MTPIDDETLMAYADGLLEAAETAELERRLAEDPEARRKVAIFRESAVLAQHALADTLREPVPARLVQAVAGGAVQTPDQAPTSSGWLDGLGDMVGGWLRPALPVAATVLLAVGIGGGYWWGVARGPDTGESGMLAAAELDREQLGRALETAASGAPVTWTSADGDGQIMLLVRATFRNKAGEFCREYEEDLARDAGNVHFFGIACRTGPAAWETRVVVAAPPADPDADTVFRPAGDPGLEVIETALDGMIDGAPFDPDDEAGLLEKGWRTAKP